MSLVHFSLKKTTNMLSLIPLIHIPVAKAHKQKKSKWSLEIQTRNLVPNPNSNRILLDSPDYSFLDKRPAPYNASQYRRVCLQREYTKKIIELSSEIDFALQLHAKRQKDKIAAEENILSRKLKQKGGFIKENEQK